MKQDIAPIFHEHGMGTLPTRWEVSLATCRVKIKRALRRRGIYVRNTTSTARLVHLADRLGLTI